MHEHRKKIKNFKNLKNRAGQGLACFYPTSLHWIRLFLDLISKKKVVIIEHQHQHLPADRCVSFIISLCASLPFIEYLSTSSSPQSLEYILTLD